MNSLYEGNSPYIFISYAHRDIGQVKPIIHDLQKKGFRIWYDSGIKVGTEWPQYIAEHIKCCSCFLFFITKNYLASSSCQNEIYYALKEKREVLPVFLEDIELDAGLDMQIGHIQALKITNSKHLMSFDEISNSDKIQICYDDTYFTEEPLSKKHFPNKISILFNRKKNKWIIGILLSICIIACLWYVSILYDYRSPFELEKEQIEEIYFLNTTPYKAWDFSEEFGEGVKAYTSPSYDNEGMYRLCIVFEDKLKLPRDCSNMFRNYSNITIIWGTELWDTSEVENMSGMFADCSLLSFIEGIESWDTSNVTDMSCMFEGCKNLYELNVSGFDTTSVKDMSRMFAECIKIKKIDNMNFDTSKAVSMSGMFRGCYNLERLDISHFDTSNVETMQMMFSGCESLDKLDVSYFDTSNVRDMSYMFESCKNLDELNVSGFDTSRVEDMSGLFWGCSDLYILDISHFNTSNVTYMDNLFSGCERLQTLDFSNWDFSKAESFDDFMDEEHQIEGVHWKKYIYEQILSN